MRKALPTLVIPFDDWGRRVAEAAAQTIRLSEPQLLRLGLVHFSEIYAETSPANPPITLLTKLQDMLARQLDLNPLDGYEPVLPKAPMVLVLALGSLSAKYSQASKVLLALHDTLRAREYYSQINLAALVEAAHFEGGQTYPFRECFPPFHNALMEGNWAGRVYLLSNYATTNVAINLACRDANDVREAAIVFTEALILSQHWKELSTNVLYRRPTGGRFYSGISGLAFYSPLQYLRDYLVHLSAHEILAKMDAGEGASPTVSPPSYQVQNREIPLGSSDFLAVMDEHLEKIKKDFKTGIPLLAPKTGVHDYINGVLDEVMHDTDEVSLTGDRQFSGATTASLSADHIVQVVDRNQMNEDTVRDLATQPTLLCDLTSFASSLLQPVDPSQSIAQVSEWKMLPKTDVRASLTYFEDIPTNVQREEASETGEFPEDVSPQIVMAYEAVKKAVLNYPNPYAFLFYMALILPLQWLLTLRLATEWLGQERGPVFFLVFVLLWIASGIVFGWFALWWPIRRALRALRSGVIQLVSEYQEIVSNNLMNLFRHWKTKSDMLVTMGQSRLSRQLRERLAYLRYQRDQLSKAYPAAPVNTEKLHIYSGRFIKLLEMPRTWEDAIREMRLGMPELLPRLLMKKSLAELWLSDQPDKILGAMLDVLKEAYLEKTIHIPGVDPLHTIQRATDNWHDLTTPLVRLSASASSRISKTMFLAYPPERESLVEQALADRVDEHSLRNNLAGDGSVQMYIFNVMDDFTAEDTDAYSEGVEKT